MSEKIKIAVDAMGGDGSPKKVIDGIIYNHKSNKNIFYKIFGDKNKISHANCDAASTSPIVSGIAISFSAKSSMISSYSSSVRHS